MTVRSFVVGGVVAALLIAALVWSTRDAAVSAPPASAKAAAKAAPGAAQARLSPSSVLAIDITKSSAPVRPSPAPPTLAREYEQSRNLKAIYDRISPSPATPEAKYVLYRILSGCAKKTDAPGADQSPARTWEQRRKRLEASLSDANPQKASDMPRGPGAISEAQLRTLQESIASRDPAAIAIAGTVLSNTFGDMVIEVGDQHEPLDHAASRHAWTLLACEYGLDCGPGNNDLRQSCALSGRCGPASVPDYIFYFDTTPNQAQLVDQYRRLFRQAIDGNDWSALTFARRPNQTNNTFRYYTSGP